MRIAGLRSRVRRKYRVRTTDSNHKQPIAPNLLAKLPSTSGLNQVWVADITYVRTGEGWLYLASILDLHSRRVVGWAMKDTLRTELPLAALHMALIHRRPASGLIHHSDRGCQYASDDYRKLLTSHGVIPSMSGKGNCYDNAAKESFFHTLKTELVYLDEFHTKAEAQRRIFDYLEGFYNRQRLHSSIGYMTPVEFEASAQAAVVAA